MLELDEGQLSRPVLRGRGGSNTSLLPGCEKQARAPPKRRAARGVSILHAETNPLGLTVVPVLRESQAITTGESLTIGSAARFTPY